MQLRGGVHALTTPVNDLVSNWAYMVMASLAWNLKAWSALMVPVSPRYAAKHEAEKRKWLRMEFATFCAEVIQIPCQIVKTGKRLILPIAIVDALAGNGPATRGAAAWLLAVLGVAA